MSTECFRIGGVILNAGTQEVTRNGQVVPLPPLSFKLLLTLARNAPNVVTTRQLEEQVWSGIVVDRGTINKRVLLVRNALHRAGCKLSYITVVRGTGYRLSVPVERIGDGSDRAGKTAIGDLSARTGPERSDYRLSGILGLLLFVLIVMLGFKEYRGDPAATNPAHSSRLKGTAQNGARVTAPITSVAVLPFIDMNEDGDTDYLADGISREVINLLTAIDDLQVAASSSSFAFRDEDVAPGAIAARLGVRALLQGSVRHFDGRIHVMARLTEARTGNILWSQSYDGILEEVFMIQDEIALRVAASLHVTVPEHEHPDSRRTITSNVEAFTLYLEGRKLADERITLGAEGLREALIHYWAATAADPGFVRAHVGIASAYFLLPAYDHTLDRLEYLDQAETSAMYALELDPDFAEAVGVLAAISARRGDSVEAGELFRRARALGNTDSNIIHWQAMLFTRMGYFEDQLGGLEDAYRLDPLNEHLGSSLAIALTLSGDPAASAEILNALNGIPTRDYNLGMTSIYLGKFDEARDLLRDVQLHMGPLPARYADLLVDAFEDPALFNEVESAFHDAVQTGALPSPLAFEALLVLGSPTAFDLDVDFTDQRFDRHMLLSAWNNWGVELRQDPRFKDWVRRLGYEEYWRKHGWPDRCRPTGLDNFECI